MIRQVKFSHIKYRKQNLFYHFSMFAKTLTKKNKKEDKLISEVQDLAKSERALELELAREVKQLSKEINRMKSMEVIQVFKSPWKFLGFSLMKGLMIGLGSILGATLLLSGLVYLLSEMRFVPVVGDFVQDVIDRIELRQQNTVQIIKIPNETVTTHQNLP